MMAIDCGTLQDRMPEVAAGSRPWTAEEAAHIAACPACAPEWRIVSAARRLGGTAARQIDSSRIAGNVIVGIRDAEKKSRQRRALWISSLTAAAILLVLVRVNLRPNRRAAEQIDTARVAFTTDGGAIPVAELDPLDADQLEAVLEHLDAAAGTTEGGGVPLMGDLDDQQLESVLRSLEG